MNSAGDSFPVGTYERGQNGDEKRNERIETGDDDHVGRDLRDGYLVWTWTVQ